MDAHRFFVERPHPHPFLAQLRNLELSLTPNTDRLFLTPIARPAITTPAAAGPADGTATTAVDLPSPGAAAASGDSSANDNHRAMASRFASIAGPDVWDVLVRGIRAAAPGLRALDVNIGGRTDQARILAVFGDVVAAPTGGDQDDAAATTAAATAEGSSAAAAAATALAGPCRDVWELPGGAVVLFTQGNVTTGYMQVGKNMVGMDLGE